MTAHLRVVLITTSEPVAERVAEVLAGLLGRDARLGFAHATMRETLEALDRR